MKQFKNEIKTYHSQQRKTCDSQGLCADRGTLPREWRRVKQVGGRTSIVKASLLPMPRVFKVILSSSRGCSVKTQTLILKRYGEMQSTLNVFRDGNAHDGPRVHHKAAGIQAAVVQALTDHWTRQSRNRATRFICDKDTKASQSTKGRKST